MTPNLFSVVTFFIGMIPGAALASTDAVRRRLGAPLVSKERRGDLITRLIGLVIIVIVGAGYWHQSQTTACQARYNGDVSSGLTARTQAAKEAGDVVIEAHNANIAYLDRLVSYLDLVQLSGAQGTDGKVPTQEYRQAITELRAAEVRSRDAQVHINVVRNASDPGPPPDC